MRKAYFALIFFSFSFALAQVDSVFISFIHDFGASRAHIQYVDLDVPYCLFKKDDAYYVVSHKLVMGPYEYITALNNKGCFVTKSPGDDRVTVINVRTHTAFDCDEAAGHWYERKMGVFFSYADKGKFFLENGYGAKYGPFKEKPVVLYSDSAEAWYQLYHKSNRNFDLYRNAEQGGSFSLKTPLVSFFHSETYNPVFHLFSDKDSMQYYFAGGALHGPYKRVKEFVLYPAGAMYATQMAGQDFFVVRHKGKEIRMNEKAQLTSSAISCLPDSSLIMLADETENYSDLSEERSYYYYHSEFGLTDPLPVEKAKCVRPLSIAPLTKNYFCYDNVYDLYQNRHTWYMYRQNRYIDSVTDFAGITIVHDRLFYKKDNKDFADGQLLNIPANSAACILGKDTFYVVHYGGCQWKLFRNRKEQKLPAMKNCDNIVLFRFQYAPLRKKLFLEIFSGYKKERNGSSDWYCPNGCFIYQVNVSDLRYESLEQREEERQLYASGGKRPIAVEGMPDRRLLLFGKLYEINWSDYELKRFNDLYDTFLMAETRKDGVMLYRVPFYKK